MFRESRRCTSPSATLSGTNWCAPSLAPIRPIADPPLNLANNIVMFDFLKHGRLVKRGLASRKRRRRRSSSELMRNVECSSHVKVFIFALFAGGLAFLVFSGQQAEPTKNYIIALLVLATAITQLWINQPKSFEQN